MKLTYALLRKQRTHNLRYLVRTLLMKLAPAGFAFAFNMFMFILISNYVYSMLQPPLFKLFYFMLYTYPSFVSFMSRWDMFLGGQDYLSILCQANLLPILNFSCKSWWLPLLFLLLFLSTFANLVEGLFYRNLLCNISCLGICLVLLYLHHSDR